jgi:predicted O-methyltransferase YrrM
VGDYIHNNEGLMMIGDWSSFIPHRAELEQYMQHILAGADREYITTFISLMHYLKPQEMLELGTEWGVSTICWLLGMKDNELPYHLTTCDILDRSVVAGGRIRSLGFGEDVCTMVMSDSKELGRRWSTFLDTLFVDADHSKEAVLAELELFAPWVKREGVILLHDPYSCPGVKQAMEEYLLRHTEGGWYMDIVPGECGIGVLSRVEAKVKGVLNVAANDPCARARAARA